MSNGIDPRPVVFLLTAGCYSDKRILGIFSSLEMADAVKRRLDEPSENESVYKCYDTNDIESYTLDEFAELGSKDYWFWTVDMGRDGTVHLASKEPDDTVFPYAMPYNGVKYTYTNGLLFTVCARNQEHAIKIVNERRAMLIAANLWKEDDGGES